MNHDNECDLIESIIPAFYIITCQSKDGKVWLWNGNWHLLKPDLFEGKYRALYIYLADDKPHEHLAILKTRNPEVWFSSNPRRPTGRRIPLLPESVSLHRIVPQIDED